jgi:hypothetical protein
VEPRDQLNRFKKICEKHFRSQGLEVHTDVAISDNVGWRPHLFVRNESKMVMDIVDEELTELQLGKYVEILNNLPEISVSIVLVGTNSYLPEMFSECYKNGLGIYVIEEGLLKQVMQPKPRSVETLAGDGQIAIVPGASFGNMLSLKKCMRKFRKYLKWFEVNLPKGSLEVLYDGIKEGDLTGIESIKLLRGVDDKLAESYRSEFQDFREEVATLDIDAELRVILRRKITGGVHGRYMYSSDEQSREIKIQLPPLNSLRGDQWDTIFTSVKVIPSFDEYWAKGTDLLDDWSVVEKAVSDHLQQKAKHAEALLRAVA